MVAWLLCISNGPWEVAFPKGQRVAGFRWLLGGRRHRVVVVFGDPITGRHQPGSYSIAWPPSSWFSRSHFGLLCELLSLWDG